jgi:hypothetical protein
MKPLEVEEANAKSRLLEAEAKARLIDADAKSRLLEAEAKVMTEEKRIMLADLDIISDPEERAWIKKRQKVIRGQWHR